MHALVLAVLITEDQCIAEHTQQAGLLSIAVLLGSLVAQLQATRKGSQKTISIKPDSSSNQALSSL